MTAARGTPRHARGGAHRGALHASEINGEAQRDDVGPVTLGPMAPTPAFGLPSPPAGGTNRGRAPPWSHRRAPPSPGRQSEAVSVGAGGAPVRRPPLHRSAPEGPGFRRSSRVGRPGADPARAPESGAPTASHRPRARGHPVPGPWVMQTGPRRSSRQLARPRASKNAPDDRAARIPARGPGQSQASGPRGSARHPAGPQAPVPPSDALPGGETTRPRRQASAPRRRAPRAPAVHSGCPRCQGRDAREARVPAPERPCVGDTVCR